MKQTLKTRILLITVTALFTAMNIAMCSFSIPVPGGHLYLCDVVICIASIFLSPFYAFFVGGVGAFLGDFIFYPTPMFVSLVTHGLQAIAISLFSHYTFKNKKIIGSIIGVSIGVVILVVGYSIGRAFIYSTPEYAILKLPYEILQGLLGAVFSIVLIYPLGLGKIYSKMIPELKTEKGNKISEEEVG